MMLINLDMDECKNGQAKCNKNTVCRNTIGSYECDCKDGYEMKGNDCVGKFYTC